MKAHGKNAAPSGAAATKPSGAAAAEKKKPVLSIPEKKSAPPALVGCRPCCCWFCPLYCCLMVTDYGCFRRVLPSVLLPYCY